MATAFYKKRIFWLIVFAFIFRLAGVYEGLPAVYNSTEHFLAKFTLKMAANRTLDPGFYIYPSFYQYILAVLYGIYFLIGILFGLFRDSYDFAVQFLIDPSLFYLTGRVVSSIISTLSIWFIYQLVKDVRDEKTAFLTATIMTLSYYSIHFARLAIQESFLIFFTILAMIYFWKSQNQVEKIFLFWAGVFCGLAIASKYNAGFLIFGLYLSVYYSWKKYNDKLGIRILLATIGILSGFLVTNPYLIYAPQKYVSGFILVTDQMYQGISLERGINYLWETKEILVHEWVLGALFLVSIIYALIKKKPFYFTLLSVAVPTILYVGSWPKKGIDYLIVCWPIFFFFSAILIIELLSKYSLKQSIHKLILAIVFIPSLLYNTHQTILSILPDTRRLTSEWILNHIDEDDRICYDKNGYDLQLIDVRRFTDYGSSAKLLPKEVKDRLLSMNNIKRNVNFVSSFRRFNSDSTNDQSLIQWKTMNELLAEGVTLLISNHDFRKMYLHSEGIETVMMKEIKRFYQELDRRFKPIQVFSPDYWIKGPLMRIYKIQG